jgi:PhnB protein
MAAVKPIPDGYPRVSAYLSVQGAAAAIDFYRDVLGATERVRMPGPNNTIAHAELEFGDSLVMLSDESPDFGNLSPKTVGGTPVGISLYVDDVDAIHAKAIAAGATEERAPEDQFYGDRTASFLDPFGHRWHIATHVEDVPPEEMEKRMAAMMQGG